MATVDVKIRELLEWKGMSAYRLAEVTGIPKGSIGRYVSGRTPVPIKLLDTIADGLGVSPWVLLNGADLPATNLELTEEEQELIAAVRHMSRKNRRVVLETAKALAELKMKGTD